MVAGNVLEMCSKARGNDPISNQLFFRHSLNHPDYFFIVTRSHNMTMCKGFVPFRFFLNFVCTVKLFKNPV